MTCPNCGSELVGVDEKRGVVYCGDCPWEEDVNEYNKRCPYCGKKRKNGGVEP